MRLGGWQQGGRHLHGDPLQDGGVHQRVGRPGTWTLLGISFILIINMKKPEDILKYGKNLHLPAGSVLIPYLQTAADEKLQEIFKKTNEGNKAPIYFYHSPILSFMHSTFFSTSLTLRVRNQRSLKRRSLIPVMHLFACQTWLRLAWGYGIIKL